MVKELASIPSSLARAVSLSLVNRATCALRLHLGCAFRHRGVQVHHPTVLVDQEAAAKAIDDAVSPLVARFGRVRVEALLPRITVRVLPDHARLTTPGVDMRAYWAGGLGDPGLIALRVFKGWEDHLRAGLEALLRLELEGA